MILQKDIWIKEYRLENEIPHFTISNTTAKQKYENRSNVDLYTKLAYAPYIGYSAGCEGLYNTINFLVMKYMTNGISKTILDVGCGVGRTMYDLAEIYPQSTFIGIDYSSSAIKRAKEILLNESKKYIAFENSEALNPRILSTKYLKNVILAQADVMELPIERSSIDFIVCTFLIDRIPNPQRAIRLLKKLLKPNGYILFSSPLNFNKEYYGGQINETLYDLNYWTNLCEFAELDVIYRFDYVPVRMNKDPRNNSNWNAMFILAKRKSKS